MRIVGFYVRHSAIASSRFENWCQISKRLFVVFTDTINILQIDKDVAIKIEKAYGEDCNTLVKEDAIYNDLHHNGPKGKDSGELVLGIPEVFWFRTRYPLWNKKPYHILVMENLGLDLFELFKQHGNQFSTKTVLMLAEQFLDRIEYLHERGYIHRDIKPENFLMGLGESKDTVYLADFGLAKNNIEFYNEKAGFAGSLIYASINTHLGISQSRRDDLESIGYVLVEFQTGRLPWLAFLNPEYV